MRHVIFALAVTSCVMLSSCNAPPHATKTDRDKTAPPGNENSGGDMYSPNPAGLPNEVEEKIFREVSPVLKANKDLFHATDQLRPLGWNVFFPISSFKGRALLKSDKYLGYTLGIDWSAENSAGIARVLGWAIYKNRD